jgi:hypothetical protein
MYDRAISAPTSPTRLSHSGKRSWEEPNWMGSPRLLNRDMKTGLSRSLQTLPTEPSAFEIGEEGWYPSPPQTTSGHQCYSCIAQTFFKYGCVRLFKPFPFVPSPPFWGWGSSGQSKCGKCSCASLLPWQILSAHPGPSHWPGRAR